MKFIHLTVILLAVFIPISTVFSSNGYFNADGSRNIVRGAGSCPALAGCDPAP